MFPHTGNINTNDVSATDVLREEGRQWQHGHKGTPSDHRMKSARDTNAGPVGNAAHSTYKHGLVLTPHD